jgi:CTD small phosphatase-like protein 2
MKTTSTNQQDVLNYLALKNSQQLSPKMTSTPSYPKNIGYGYNQQVKNDSNIPTKGMPSSPKAPTNDLLRQYPNPQKAEMYVERKNSKLGQDRNGKEQQQPTISATIAGIVNSPRYNQKIKLLDDKRISVEKPLNKGNSMEQSTSANNLTKHYQNLKAAESLILKENNRPEPDNIKQRKLEINTDSSGSYNTFKIPMGYKPATTKNKDTAEKVQENSINKNVQSHSSLEFVSKFNAQRSPNTINSTVSTTGTENGSPLLSAGYGNNNYDGYAEDRRNPPQQQQQQQKKTNTILNKFFAQVDQKPSQSPQREQAGRKEANLSQNNATTSPKGQVKINNFFASPSYTNQNGGGSVEPKKDNKPLNRTQKLEQEASSRNQYSNSGYQDDDERDAMNGKKMFSRTHMDLKTSLKQENTSASNSNLPKGNTYDYRNDPNDHRNSQPLNLRYSYNTEALRNSSYLSNQLQPNQNNVNDNKPNVSANSSPKAGLNSFVTKVDKGAMFAMKQSTQLTPSEPTTTKNNPMANSAVLSSNSLSSKNTQNDNQAGKKSYLNLDDKYAAKSTKDSQVSSSTILNRGGVKSTTNAEAKAFSFNQQSIASSQPVQPAASGRTQQSELTSTAKKQTLKLVAKPSTPSNRSLSTNNREVENSPAPVSRAVPQIYYMSNLEKYHRHPDEKDYFSQIYREHYLQTFQAMAFCKYLKTVDSKVLAQKKVYLPKREAYKDKKTIVFDLDETLIHCNESLDIPYDVKLPIKFPHGEIIEAGINVRPYAVECLKELSQYFEIIVFTASHGCYANVVLDYLDPKEQYIHHRLFRESCVTTEEGIYIKDLRVLANRNLADVVIVDNAAYSFGYQVENGIPCIPFYDNKTDTELKMLVPYLKFLNGIRDLREINRSTFKLHMYTMYDTPDKVLEKVVYSKN